MEKKVIPQAEENTTTVIPRECEDLKNRTLEGINKLLEKEKIKYIFYIDDKIGETEQKAFFVGRMKYVRNEGNPPEDLAGFDSIDWESPEAKFLQDTEELWSKTENKKILIHNICNHIGNKESADIIPVLEIEEVLGEKIVLFTPQEWVEKKDTKLGDLAEDEKVLCLFDFQLGDFRGPNGEKNGVQLIKSLVESPFKEKVFCGIFSHKYTIEKEDSYRTDYSVKFSLDSKEFYAISKKRFASNSQLSAFSEGIKNVLSLKYIENLKKNSIEILEKSLKKSIDELRNISPKTFNQIIQKASNKEGIWEIDTFFRLFSIINNYNNYETLTSSTNVELFNNSIQKIRSLDKVETGYFYNHKDSHAVGLRSKEVFFEGKTLNKLHYPIANGDIFQIGTRKYILLVQPCNLTLRSDGRRNYNYDKGIMIPLKEIESSKVNPITNQIIKNPNITNEKKLCAIFPNYKILSLNILDLCVFRDDGKCIIDLKIDNIDGNTLIHSPWKIRYKKVLKEFRKHEKVFITHKKLETELTGEHRNEARRLTPYFNKPYCIKDFSMGEHKVYNHQNQTLDFKIHRIKHYRERFSMDLLQGFLQYLSRNAFDIDFSNV